MTNLETRVREYFETSNKSDINWIYNEAINEGLLYGNNIYRNDSYNLSEFIKEKDWDLATLVYNCRNSSHFDINDLYFAYDSDNLEIVSFDRLPDSEVDELINAICETKNAFGIDKLQFIFDTDAAEDELVPDEDIEFIDTILIEYIDTILKDIFEEVHN